MFDQVLDNFRKATESTVRLQQEMVKQWTQQWANMPGVPSVPAFSTAPFSNPWTEHAQEFQSKWVKSITDMLKKHCESLDAQYEAGIRTIEDAFRVGEAKDPAQYRRLTEELWRHSFDCLKTVAEDRMREFQAVAQKWCELTSNGLATVKK